MLWSMIFTAGAISLGNNASDAGLHRLAIFMMVISGITLIAAIGYLYYLKREKKKKKSRKINVN